VLLALREDGLLLPRRPARTGRVHRAVATYPAVHDFLTNPCYAGAFVFGRNRTEKRLDAAGRVISRTVALPREQWAVLIPDHHPGFISWQTYEANTALLRANWRAPRGHAHRLRRPGPTRYAPQPEREEGLLLRAGPTWPGWSRAAVGFLRMVGVVGQVDSRDARRGHRCRATSVKPFTMPAPGPAKVG
jgi:hypothetical protein